MQLPVAVFAKEKETQLSEWDIFLPQKFHKAKKKLGSSFRDKRAILKSPSVYSLNVKTSHQFHVQVQIWNYKSFYWSKDRLQKEEERVLHIESYKYYTSKWFQICILSCGVPKTKSKHWYSLFEIFCGYLGNSPVAICFDLWIDLFKGRRIWTQDYFQDIHSKSQINCVNVSILFWGGLGMTIENLKSILRINFFFFSKFSWYKVSKGYFYG